MKSSTDIQRQQLETRVALAQRNPWYYLRYLVYTMDEHDPTILAKPFPSKAMYRIVTRAWQQYDVLFIEKSRQIMMTWIMAALDLWDAMTLYNRLIAFQSKKQIDADKVLKRAKFIYEQLIGLGIPWVPEAKRTGNKIGTSDNMSFPLTNSEIESIPQGEDIVRSNTYSRILADEMNHQPEFAEGYAAANPTITGGGRYTAQGTANGRGFGYQMLYGIDDRTLEKLGPHQIDSDKISNLPIQIPNHLDDEQKIRWLDNYIVEMDEDEFQRIPFEELVACMPGMRYWRTASRMGEGPGIDCLRVHYTADPEKNPKTAAGREWLPVAKSRMSPTKWDREMEIKYDTFEGRPVITSFKEELYVKPLEINDFVPLRLTFDFGQNCCCLFSQLFRINKWNAKRINYLDEIFLEMADTVQLIYHVKKLLESRFSYHWENNKIIAHCDPAGNQTRETTSDKSINSSVKLLQANSIYPKSKKFGVPESTEFVTEVFDRILPDDLPAVMIDDRCKFLIEVVNGGWHYPQKATLGRTGYPEKDNYFEHGGDALRYDICNGFDEFDIQDVQRKVKKVEYARRPFTGEIIGRKKSRRREPSRGQHARHI